jgi:hypothetical protein
MAALVETMPDVLGCQEAEALAAALERSIRMATR